MRNPIRVLVLAVLSALFAAPCAHGQMGRGASDEQIVREARLVASGDRVELYQHGLTVPPELLHRGEEALGRIETLLGQKLDEATLGHKVRIYVSSEVRVSHVWHGYDHPSDPKAIIFLNPRVARGAIDGTNATYAHEMTHLLTWRFHSHTLREGLADYVALTLHPGAGVGPNPQGYAKPPVVTAEIEKYQGTTKSPPSTVESDPQFRQAYYYGCYRFVASLIARQDLSVFLKLYQSKNPEAEFPKLYGASRTELVVGARNQL